MSKMIRWEKTKRHDETGVVIVGSVALPVSVLILFFFVSQILWLLLNWLGDAAFGWNGVGFSVFGIFWGVIAVAGALYVVGFGAWWVYTTLRDANSWKVGDRE